jgi:hypothetical protein
MTTLKKRTSSRKTMKMRSSSKTREYTFKGEYKLKDGVVMRYVSPDITHVVLMVGTTRLVYDSNRLVIKLLNGVFKMSLEFMNTKKGILNYWEKEMILKNLKINPFRKTLRVVLSEYDYNNGRVCRKVYKVPYVIHLTSKGWERVMEVLKEEWLNEGKCVDCKNQE